MSKIYKRRVDSVFGIPVHTWPREDILSEMNNNIKIERLSKHISITSGELMYNARRIEFLPEYIKTAGFSLCDSMSVVIAGYIYGGIIRRFTGPMLMQECFDYGVSHNWKHFFCGGAEGVADILSEKVSQKYPGIKIAGTFCPPFRKLTPQEETQMIETINQAKPDILWIGLGVVKQEMWIHRYKKQLNVPWMVGVGGAFDFHAGTVQWAPDWIKKIGMEWLYRLIKEPWRYKRIMSSHIFTLETILSRVLGKTIIIGGKQTGEVKPPEWRGKSETSLSDKQNQSI